MQIIYINRNAASFEMRWHIMLQAYAITDAVRPDVIYSLQNCLICCYVNKKQGWLYDYHIV
jgi:hypothetical protein